MPPLHRPGCELLPWRVAFSAILPLMTIVNYSVQDIIAPTTGASSAPEWFAQYCRTKELQAR